MAHLDREALLVKEGTQVSLVMTDFWVPLVFLDSKDGLVNLGLWALRVTKVNRPLFQIIWLEDHPVIREIEVNMVAMALLVLLAFEDHLDNLDLLDSQA